MMKLQKILAAIIFLFSGQYVYAQSDIGRVLTAGERAKMNSSSQLLSQSKKEFEKKNFLAAISLARQSMRPAWEVGYRRFDQQYAVITNAYWALGLREESLQAHKNSTLWTGSTISGMRELHIKYAQRLLDCGRDNDAKLIYYFLLEQFANDAEPRPPITVVFDEGHGGDFWQYTQNRMRSVLESMAGHGKPANALFPEWYYPHLLIAEQSDPEDRITILQMSRDQCRTDQERTWVDHMTGVFGASDFNDKMKILFPKKNRESFVKNIDLIQMKKDEFAKRWQELSVSESPEPILLSQSLGISCSRAISSHCTHRTVE